MILIISFIMFLIMFLGIGIYSATRSKETPEDYLVAGRNVPAWLTALSAVATNNSGYMFIGLIGATYTMGISAIWIMVGWISGDYLAWLFIHKRMREVTGELRLNSVPSLLAQTAKGISRPVATVAGLIILFYLGLYASAQITAGGKALFSIFGWSEFIGKTIGIAIVVIYCFSGGIRASIWTDAAQSVVMIFAMGLLLFLGISETGGIEGLWTNLAKIDNNLVKVFPDKEFGFPIYLLGWIAAGLGVVGQPHVMVRAMAIKSPEDIKPARRIYFSWYIAFTIAAIGVGLCTRVLLPPDSWPLGKLDPELALPFLTKALLPEILIGLTLAGLFAATMSTADSQVLSCSAAITTDIFPKWRKSYIHTKIGTLFVASLVYALAIFGSNNVFNMVVDAWAALAASLGPLLIAQVFKRKMTTPLALLTMLSGLFTVYIWWWVLPPIWSSAIYAVLPAMTVGTLVYFLFARILRV